MDLLHATARLAAKRTFCFTVAVPPTRPEIGYGYIEPGQAIGEASGVRAFRVASFREKPDEETAEAYARAGHL